MTEPGIYPPPHPSTPKRAPWDEPGEAVKRLDEIVRLLGGAPGQPPPVDGSLVEALLKLVEVLQGLVPESIGNSHVIPFQKTIATSYQDEQDRGIPISGVVRDVIMAFPAGCQHLVDVRLIYYPTGGSRVLIVPTIDDSFIALDDFTAVFSPHFLVKAPGNLRVEWWNYDSLNTHSVPVVVLLAPSEVQGG